MKAVIGALITITAATATWYGYTDSMTTNQFPIQGVLGTIMPVLFMLISSLLTAAYIYNSSD